MAANRPRQEAIVASNQLTYNPMYQYSNLEYPNLNFSDAINESKTISEGRLSAVLAV